MTTDPKPLPGEVREPMPCPWCGEIPETRDFSQPPMKSLPWMAQCQTENCIMSRDQYSPGKWNKPIHPARLAAEGLTRPSSPEADRLLEQREAFRELAEATQAFWDATEQAIDKPDFKRQEQYQAAKSRHKSASAAVGDLKGVV